MGSICYSQESQLIVDEKKTAQKQRITVSGIETLKQLQFQFSTQKLIHVTGDLLVIFNDLSTNIKRNDHFTKLPMQGAKLEQHAKAHIERHKPKNEAGAMKPHFVTFNIIIPTLNFTKVSILFCQMWTENQHNESAFKDLLRDYFDSLKNQKIKSMAITEFTSQLGVHLQRGVKRIMHEISRMPAKPQVIQFCCLTDESKSVYVNGVKENKEAIEKSFGSASSKGGESHYY